MATSVTGGQIKMLTVILIFLFVSRCVFNVTVAVTHKVDFEVAGVCCLCVCMHACVRLSGCVLCFACTCMDSVRVHGMLMRLGLGAK